MKGYQVHKGEKYPTFKQLFGVGCMYSDKRANGRRYKAELPGHSHKQREFAFESRMSLLGSIFKAKDGTIQRVDNVAWYRSYYFVVYTTTVRDVPVDIASSAAFYREADQCIEIRKKEKPKSEDMSIDMTKEINIGREKLSTYLKAATPRQVIYIDKHFSATGRTTVGGLRGLRDIACDEWKAKIEADFPECFEQDKYVDLRGLKLSRSFEPGKFGGNTIFEQFSALQVRGVGKYAFKGFYLAHEYNWEIITDEHDYLVLVPTRKTV